MAFLGGLLASAGTALVGGAVNKLGQRLGIFPQAMSAAPAVARTAGTLATGAAIGAGVGDATKKKRRRRRKRLTNSEISELMQLKMLFGARSPIITIAGIKMLNRGA